MLGREVARDLEPRGPIVTRTKRAVGLGQQVQALLGRHAREIPDRERPVPAASGSLGERPSSVTPSGTVRTRSRGRPRYPAMKPRSSR